MPSVGRHRPAGHGTAGTIGGRGPLRLNFHADFQAGPEHSVAVVDLGDDPAGLGFRIDLAVDEDDVTQERLVLDRGAGTLGQDPDALPRSARQASLRLRKPVTFKRSRLTTRKTGSLNLTDSP